MIGLNVLAIRFGLFRASWRGVATTIRFASGAAGSPGGEVLQLFVWQGSLVARAIHLSAHPLPLGACPIVCRRGTPATSVAALGTFAIGGLSGVVLCKAAGTSVLSCDG